MTNKTDMAIRLIASGNVPTRVERTTGGRPRIRWEIGNLELTEDEYRALSKTPAMKQTIFSQQDLVELARSGVPGLLERAHRLAMESDDIKAILMVAKELMDRSFGKAVQGININTSDDITQAWRQIGVIDGEVEEKGEEEAENDTTRD